MVLFAIQLQDIPDILGSLLCLVTVLKLELDRIGVYELMSRKMYYRLLVLCVLAYQILIVSREVYHLYVSRNMVQNLILFEENPLRLRQVIKLDCV